MVIFCNARKDVKKTPLHTSTVSVGQIDEFLNQSDFYKAVVQFDHEQFQDPSFMSKKRPTFCLLLPWFF